METKLQNQIQKNNSGRIVYQSTCKYYQLIPGKIMDCLPEIEGMKQIKNISGYRRVCFFQILSIIAFHTRKDKGPAPLMTDLINKEVPQGHEILKALIDVGIIERSGTPKAGVTSYKYKISPAWDSRFRVLPLEDPKLSRRLDRLKLQTKKRTKHPEQNKYIRKLKIDQGAINYIGGIEDTGKHNAALASAVKIMNGDIFYSVDSTSGRYHSNLTNLPGHLRQFITIEGQHLTNIDLKNSQPYLSTLLLTDPGKVSPFAKDRNFSMFTKSLEPVNYEDVKRYTNLVISGRIYEYLMQEFAKHGMTYTRVEVKRKFFIILFAKNTIVTRERKIFAELFPNVHLRFSEVRGNSTDKSKFKNSKRLAILLQAVEAHLILGRVLPRIYEDHPGVIAVSIHDSVCTSIITSDIETVKSVMIQELTDFVRLIPTLKTEKKSTEKNRPMQRLNLDINNQVREEKKREEEEGKGYREGRDQYVAKTFVINSKSITCEEYN